MGLRVPPGPKYLLKLVPYFGLPSLVLYAFLHVLRSHLPFGIPKWLLITLSVFSRPILFFSQRFYARYKNRRDAKAHGAVLLPEVQESTWSVMEKSFRMLEVDFPGELNKAWSETYGHAFTVSRIFNDAIVITMEPHHFKAVLATQFEAFEKGETFRNQLNDFFGTGIFNTDGEMWKFHRSMTRPFFTKERISDFEIYERNSELTISLLKSRISEGHAVDVQDLAGRFTLDSATSFLFGYNVGSLTCGIPYPPPYAHLNPPDLKSHSSNRFVKAFTEGLYNSAFRTVLEQDWPLLEFWEDKVKPLREVIDEFTGPVMYEALKKQRAMPTEEKGREVKESKEEETLLSHLVQHTQDPKIIQDELLNLLVAGRDTTMCLLTYSLYMITQHPDIEQRLRTEISDVVGSNGLPTYENMRGLKYVRAFLNEVLRLYPPVPLNSKICNKPIIIPPITPDAKPVYLPANTTMEYAVVNLHRRKDLWGPDADVFDPDRFLDERLHKYLTPNPFIFCPFNAGPRICLGQQFAYHEASYFLIRMLQQFTNFKLDEAYNIKPPEDWKRTRPNEKVQSLSHLTMYINGGLWLHMKEVQ